MSNEDTPELKLEVGKTYEDDRGERWRVVDIDEQRGPKLCALAINDKDHGVTWFFIDGSPGVLSLTSLVREVRPKIVRYLNVYDGTFGGNYATREEADAYKLADNLKDGRVACLRIEYEKDRFDD